MCKSTSDITSTEPISTIYSLCDQSGNVRYIGITIKSLGQRLKQHIQAAKRGNRSHRSNWIRSLSYSPVVSEIEQTFDKSRERYWIAFYRDAGALLTNLTDGGDGMLGHKPSPETLAKRSASLKGRKFSAEHLAKMSENAKKQFADPAMRAKFSEQHRGKKLSADVRARISEGHKGLIKSPETRARMGEASKRNWQDATIRAKIIAANTGKKHSDERRANIKASWVIRRKKIAARRALVQCIFDF